MCKRVLSRRAPLVYMLAAGISFASTLCQAADEIASKAPLSKQGLYMKVQLARNLKMSKLKPGDVVAGTLSRDVYSSDRKLFATGSRVQLTVDHTERRKRPANDHWPWVVRAFTPRHESYPIFKSASVMQGPVESSLDVSLVSVSRMQEVHATAKKGKSPGSENGAVDVSKAGRRKLAAPIVVLEAADVDRLPSVVDTQGEDELSSSNPSSPELIPAGTHCRILLLGNVSASKSRVGDEVAARLLEPVVLNSRVALPAGSIFKGRVVKKTPPRWLSRPGSLYLTFAEVILPEGTRLPIAASLAGAELDDRSHTRIDAEGQLHGEHPGKAWMAINLGVSAGISKEVDDGVQLLIEALVSTATDASTAGTARIVSSCVSGLYMATRHGRDVVLPRFTEMDVSIDRAVVLNKPAQMQSAVVSPSIGNVP